MRLPLRRAILWKSCCWMKSGSVSDFRRGAKPAAFSAL
jgi:hypothetical protein